MKFFLRASQLASLVVVISATRPAAACVSSLECHAGQVCQNGTCETPTAPIIFERNSAMRHVGGWMFAVGLPVFAAGGVMAVAGFAGGGTASPHAHEVIGIVGATLAGAALVTWVTGLTLFEIGGQPVAKMSAGLTPSLTGDSPAFGLLMHGHL